MPGILAEERDRSGGESSTSCKTKVAEGKTVDVDVGGGINLSLSPTSSPSHWQSSTPDSSGK